MTGCQPQPQKVSESIAKEPSDMRTTVPLVRKLDPNQTGPIELEFDVPAWADNPSPPLFIGVRLTNVDPAAAADGDSTAVSDAADRLRAADVSAEVHLYRIQESGQIAVSLQRSQWKTGFGPGEAVVSLAVPADGLVPGLTPADADVDTMEAAGLLPPGSTYREFAKYSELEFAYAPSVPSGRYRATIRFVRNREALFKENAALINSELIIAYPRQGK
ncbi:hypothetical protein CSC73_12080 [Pseudoxanthomonas sacheonensis]|nr:hypothetical protein CSC73_12080 [Pseudoxanthomonas sacheonensis]